MSSPGSTTHPLRVAIVGSGPAAFYTAEHLQKQRDYAVQIDIFERLPTPFGLVRGGVAPDHAKIKSVAVTYDRIASRPNVRFFGNVHIGADLTRADLLAHYHAVVYAVGAQTDRQLEIPGEDLPGSRAATELVGWYNGHPDYRDLTFDLSAERVAVIGNGNVAMDVVRMLARAPEELVATDIAPYALDALRASRVREIVILGRRGPVQTKFTHAELKELGELANADVIVDPAELELDPLSEEYLRSGEDRSAQHNYALLQEFAQTSPQGHPRRIVMRFLVSPVEILGEERVEALRLVRNEICEREHFLHPCPTEDYQTIPVGLLFRSIGYHGVPLPGVPFDRRRGVIPNAAGRVQDEIGVTQPGEYAVGWIKRGPSGIIGTNKPDAGETAAKLLEDAAAGALNWPTHPQPDAMDALLAARGVRVVTYDDWRLLDRLEIERGQAVGRPRVKFCSVDEMLDALAAHQGAVAEAPEQAVVGD